MIHHYWREGKGSPLWLLLSIVGIPLPWLIQKLTYPLINDPTLRMYLAISVSLVGFALIAGSFSGIDFWEKQSKRLGILNLLIIGPGILIFL